jgi:hypothetical protein
MRCFFVLVRRTPPLLLLSEKPTPVALRLPKTNWQGS